MKRTLTQEQKEYKLLAKRANQRLLRLERLEKKQGEDYVKAPAHELAEYYLGERGKRRWSENPATLTQEDMRVMQAEISQFLNMPTSRTGEARKLGKAYLEAKKQGFLDIKQYSKTGKDLTQANENRAKALEKAIPGLQIINPAEFMSAMSIFHSLKLDKIFSYRTIASAIGEAKGASYKDIISEIVDVSKQERVTRREMIDRFKKLRR